MSKAKRTSVLLKVLLVLLTVAILAMAAEHLIYYRDYGKKEIFERYQEDFELLKDFFLALTPEDEGYHSIGYAVFFYEDKGFVLYRPPKGWGMEEQAALNRIAEIFTRSWNEAYIRVTPARISFEGLGNEMVVYTANGRRPAYYFENSPWIHFKVERLDKNWFYLRNPVR